MFSIDDDIEASGYVQVVKTDDRGVARELGVATYVIRLCNYMLYYASCANTKGSRSGKGLAQ